MTANIVKKNNKYYVVVSWKTNGKRQQKWVNTDLSVTGNNKRKAEQKRIEILNEYTEKLSLYNYEDILFSDFLKKWLVEIKHTISENTYYIYDKVVSGVICPYFKDLGVKLSDLKTYHIQDFYSYKMEYDGVSATTIWHYHANIHKALKFAVKTERIKSNPADNVELPKREKHVVDYYNAEELKTLLRAVKNTELETVVLIATWFGLRRGEIIGLKWSSIDLVNKTLTVNGTMVLTNEMKYQETAKNKSSLRTLPMTDEAVNYFNALKVKQEDNRKRYGRRYNNDWNDFVCVRENGDIIKLSYVSKKFPQLCKKCDLRPINIHALRHSNISLLLANNITLKEIQEWAGHSTYSTTADIYAHIQSQNKIKLSNTIQKALSDIN